MKVNARTLALTPVSVLRRLLGVTLTLSIAAFLILFALQFSHSSRLDMLWLVIQIHNYGDPVVSAIGGIFKWDWPSTSTSFLPIGVALLTWGVKIGLDAVFNQGQKMLGKFVPGPQPVTATAGGIGFPDGSGFEIGAASADSEQAREELLKRFRDIEKKLKAVKRKKCTFLSVDVVGSTAMKVGERENDVAATFQAYEEMLRKIFEKYGAWKQAWTPDGVMICFLDHDLAVAAGQRVLQSLKKFNESENKLRTPFSVRCGMNEGEVPIYEDSKLEKIADRIIDVAGHMQKQGTPGRLWIPNHLYEGLSSKSGFEPLEVTVIDGYRVYEWKPDSV